MTDDEFLKLKNTYYADGFDDSLPVSAVRGGTPGKANNREQNALRWGYEHAMQQAKDRLIASLFGEAR